MDSGQGRYITKSCMRIPLGTTPHRSLSNIYRRKTTQPTHRYTLPIPPTRFPLATTHFLNHLHLLFARIYRWRSRCKAWALEGRLRWAWGRGEDWGWDSPPQSILVSICTHMVIRQAVCRPLKVTRTSVFPFFLIGILILMTFLTSLQYLFASTPNGHHSLAQYVQSDQLPIYSSQQFSTHAFVPQQVVPHPYHHNFTHPQVVLETQTRTTSSGYVQPTDTSIGYSVTPPDGTSSLGQDVNLQPQIHHPAGSPGQRQPPFDHEQRFNLEGDDAPSSSQTTYQPRNVSHPPYSESTTFPPELRANTDDGFIAMQRATQGPQVPQAHSLQVEMCATQSHQSGFSFLQGPDPAMTHTRGPESDWARAAQIQEKRHRQWQHTRQHSGSASFSSSSPSGALDANANHQVTAQHRSARDDRFSTFEPQSFPVHTLADKIPSGGESAGTRDDNYYHDIHADDRLVCNRSSSNYPS